MTDTQNIEVHAASVGRGTTVAITGATGFIGGRLAECLIERGADVTCLVRSSQGTSRLQHIGAKLVTLDIADAASVRSALAGIEVVFHCAYSWNDTEWNVRALAALIEACRADRCRRLVHVSSFVVYELPEQGEVTEQSAAETSAGGYAHTKRRLEDMLLTAVREQDLPGTIVQPTIVYGPFCKPWTIDPADTLRYGTVVLPDDGEGACNAVYVDDVVSGMILAAEQPAAVGQRFLISGPEPTTWRRFYEGFAQAIGAKGPQFRPAAALAREAGKTRRIIRLATDPGDVMRRVARIGPCRKVLDACLGALPHESRTMAQVELFGPVTRRRGRVHLPNIGHLGFLRCRATIMSSKARRELGYAPVYDLDAGMVPTGQYLRDLYKEGDRKAS